MSQAKHYTVDVEGSFLGPAPDGVQALFDLVETENRTEVNRILAGGQIHGVRLFEDTSGTSYTIRVTVDDENLRQVELLPEVLPESTDSGEVLLLQSAYKHQQVWIRALASSMQQGFLVFSFDGDLIYANQHFLEMTGLEKVHPASIRGPDFVVEAYRPRTEERLRLLRERGTYSYFTTMRGPNGTTFPGKLTANVSTIDPSIYFLIVEDVTEQRNIEETLAELIERVSTTHGEERYGVLAESLANWFEVDAVGIVAHSPDAMEGTTRAWYVDGELLDNYSYPLPGRPCHELTGQTSLAFPHGLQLVYPKVQDFRDFGAEAYFGVALRDSNNKTIGHIACLNRNLVHNIDVMMVQLRTIAALASDELLRERLEAELLEAQTQMQAMKKMESLGLLAGGIAHDFNNLLAVIMGHTELAESQLKGQEELTLHLDQIRESTARASELCNQMLAYAGRGRYVVQHASIDTLTREMENLLVAAASKDAELALSLNDENMAVKVDRTQFSQLLLNFVTNASDALGERHGTITINTTKIAYDGTSPINGMLSPLTPGEYIILSVSDTGIGMTQEEQQRMFDPFYTTKPEGRGLGLAAALGIVVGHRGGIAVESEPGKGTRMSVWQPVVGESAELEQAQIQHPIGRLANLTVLVVDDEGGVREVISQMLSARGGNVLDAENGKVALSRLETNPIDLVLLDMTMPYMDGRETLEGIRASHPTLPVLLISGYVDQDITQGIELDDYTHFAHKPISSADLDKALNTLFETKQH